MKRLQPVLRLATLTACALMLPLGAPAQSRYSTDGTTAPAIAPGAPAGAYALSGFESVNSFNGHLNFTMPLLKVGGRGQAGYTMSLRIEKKWRIENVKTPTGCGQNGCTGFQRNWYPNPNWWHGIDPGYGPGVMEGRVGGIHRGTCPVNSQGYVNTRLTFTAGDGTEFEFVDQDSDGQPYWIQNCSGTHSRGTVWVTKGGQAATFVSDTAISETLAVSVFYPSGHLMLKDGTRYRIDGGKVSWIRDANGNKVSFAYDAYSRVTTATDSLNRVVTVSYGATNNDPDTITYRGAGGAARTITVGHANLNGVLRSGYSIQTYHQLFSDLGNTSMTTPFDPSGVVSYVRLPDNRQYNFYYDPHQELARVVLPTGGAIEYDWSGSIAVINDDTKEIKRRVTERRTYPDGGSGTAYELKTAYTNTLAWDQTLGQITTMAVDSYKNGSVLITGQKHYFYGGAYVPTSNYDSPKWRESKEYKTESYDTGGALLRKADQTWAQRAAVSWWVGSQDDAPANDPRVTETVTTLADVTPNLVSKQTLTYSNDAYNNVTDVYEYDYGSGAPGALVRRTHTDYVTTNNGVNYATDTGIHLRGLPLARQVYDGAGNKQSETVYEYDGYSGTNRAALVTRSGISGLCDGSAQNCPNGPDFTSQSYTARGNVTAVTSYANAAAQTGAVTAYSQYDVAGNVVKTVDARGYATTFDFSDRLGSPDGEAQSNSTPPTPGGTWLNGQTTYAFPTKVTNALGHIAYTQFDYFLGKPVDSEDPNNVKSSLYYNDSLDRPTKGISAVSTSAQAQTNIFYDDANKVITVAKDRQSQGESASTPTPGGLVSKAYYDGLGRTFRASAYEGNTGSGNTWSVTVTEFDALGRAYRATNPFRAGAADAALPGSPEWTTTSFDALGRVTSVQTPDGAQVATAYSGDLVLVTDQANKKRLSKTNALGHLTDVWEILAAADGASETVTFGTTLNGYRTTYTYGALDNLLTVKQRVGTSGTLQTRTFVYDSLKRLTSATNPESGTTGYTYDNGGNLLTRTDARSVVTTMAYDALNRPTSKTYSTTGTTALATPTVNYYYDNQSLPSGAPSYTRGASLGRLVATTHGGGSEGSYFAYDSQGRVVEKWQRIVSTNYRVQANYDLAGAMTWQKYPSNNEVEYAFDQAGRLSEFKGKLGGSASQVIYSTGLTYSAAGQMKRERFGTANNSNGGLFHRRHYNKRGQLYDIRLGTSNSTTLDNENPNDWQYATGGWDRGALRLFYTSDLSDYGTTPSAANNNGNLYRADHFMPANDAISDWAMNVQVYTYDDVNRLKSVTESAQLSAGALPAHLQQTFKYDRWGNRTIDQANTWAKDGTAWVEDALPTGAVAVGDNDGWNWVTSSPTAFSGTSSHQSATVTGTHQHYFYGATQTLTPTTGEKLYAWVYLDPTNPPTEVMLQWNDGTNWEHRAYWGANQIGWGTDGTASRRYMGPLPETGRWVRLEVSANSVGLEGQTISGMAFTLYGGKATWDRAGKTAVANGGVNDKAYSIDVATNRLGVPAGQAGTMSYDAAGNVVTDGYTNSALGNHKYDAENKLREVYTGLGSLTAQYFYDGEGQRVRRFSGTQETWQVYGIGGGLLAEYTSTSPTTVQKEYGYRNGQLLVVWDNAETGDKRLQWLVADHLGTTRMVIDQAGILSGVKRHDYLPFGEELYAGVGARSLAHGFVADGVRQKVTGKERDIETGLDYFEARYFSSVQGRFTSPDPMLSSGNLESPSTWNRYSYGLNNPLRYTDPLGLYIWDKSLGGDVSDEDLIRNAGKDKKKLKQANKIIKLRNQFRAALEQAENASTDSRVSHAEGSQVAEAVAAYSGEGVANGVSVGVGKVKDGTGAQTQVVGYETLANGSVVGAKVNVTFSEKTKGTDLAIAVAHEGRHVANAQAVVSIWTLTGSYEKARDSNLNIHRYTNEFGAYQVSAYTAKGLGLSSLTYSGGNQIWRSGMTGVDSQAINSLLKDKYKLTPSCRRGQPDRILP